MSMHFEVAFGNKAIIKDLIVSEIGMELVGRVHFIPTLAGAAGAARRRLWLPSLAM